MRPQLCLWRKVFRNAINTTNKDGNTVVLTVSKLEVSLASAKVGTETITLTETLDLISGSQKLGAITKGSSVSSTSLTWNAKSVYLEGTYEGKAVKLPLDLRSFTSALNPSAALQVDNSLAFVIDLSSVLNFTDKGLDLSEFDALDFTSPNGDQQEFLDYLQARSFNELSLIYDADNDGNFEATESQVETTPVDEPDISDDDG